MDGQGDSDNIKLGKQILRPQDFEIEVNYKNEVFVMRYPTPHVKNIIETDIARRLDGQPRNCFSEEHLAMIEAGAYVNALIIPEKSPSWFISAWTCYDDELIATLYGAYLTFRKQFRENIQKDKFIRNS